MDWGTEILIALIWLAVVSTWGYGLSGGFGSRGRSLGGRIFLGALSGPVLASLFGVLIGMMDRSNPWAGSHHEVSLGESVCINALTLSFFWGVPTAILGAGLGFIVWKKTSHREREK